MRVSEAQQRALEAISDGWTYTPYAADISTNTMSALVRRGLAEERTPCGYMGVMFPRTHRMFRITPAGRKALESSDV
jgi:hypothetical protein